MYVSVYVSACVPRLVHYFFRPNPRVSRAPSIHLIVNIMNAFSHPFGFIWFVVVVVFSYSVDSS